MARAEVSSNLAARSSGARSASGNRHLAAVLAADVVGYTTRMEADDDGVYRTLVKCRDLMASIVSRHDGRVVQTPGDFFLCLFASSVRAVEAAIDMQLQLGNRNSQAKADEQLQFRLGIALGDVVERASDLYGPAINLASRLQALAAPGDVVIPDMVYQLVRYRANFEFSDLGERRLRNVRDPVRVYSVRSRSRTPPARSTEPLADNGERRGDLRRPTIEVSPLKPLSAGDAANLYAAGITDELITTLARLTSTITVREALRAGAATHPDCYVVEGGVRLLSEEVKVSVRLIRKDDSVTIWADRYVYRLSDTFDLHEVVVREIVAALQVRLTEGEQARLWHSRTARTRAWELFQRGHDLERKYTRETHAEARQMYGSAVEEDPEYIVAIVALAFCYVDDIRLGWANDPEAALQEASRLAGRATKIDCDFPDLHALKAYILFEQGDHVRALDEGRRAVELAPRNAELVAVLGTLCDTLGMFDDAIDAYRRAMSLSPYYSTWIASNLALTYCVSGRAQEAREIFLQVLAHEPNYVRAHIGLAVACVRLGLKREAERAARIVGQLDPRFDTNAWALNQLYTEQKVIDEFVRDLRIAGLK